MKRIIALWIVGFLLAAQQSTAAVSVGFGDTSEPNLLLHWTGLGTGQETLLKTSEATTITNDGATFDANGANLDATSENVDITATNGNNYVAAQGTIKATFKQSAVDSPQYAVLFSLYGTNGIRFSRYISTTDRYTIVACGATFTSSSGMPNIWDQNSHTVEMAWNDSSNVIKFRIDGGTVYSSTGLTLDCSTTNATILTAGNLRATGTDAINGAIKDVKIYSTDNF